MPELRPASQPRLAPGDEHLAQIGEVADRLGLSLRTLRHWEEVGLVVPTARTEGGFRLYSNDDVERLEIVMRMKPLGLNLSEVRTLLELVEASGGDNLLAAEDLAARHDELSEYLLRCEEAVAKLERRLREGRELRGQLRTLVADCERVIGLRLKEQTVPAGNPAAPRDSLDGLSGTLT
jgi:DNA-binding transcriptional MerR regulator